MSAGRVLLFVVVRDIGGEVTLERQIGYVAKDIGQAHFAVDWLKNVTHDVLRARGAAYAQVAGGNVWHSKTELKPYTMWTVVAKWEQSTFFPLNIRMNVYQVVRFMLLSKKYMLAASWCAPYCGRFADRATHAYLNITRTLRLHDTVDIWDVVSVLTRGNYGAGSACHMYLQERCTDFDDMTLDHAKRLSRRAHQVLQPHLQHGVIVGDVDVDALFENLEAPDVDAAGEQEEPLPEGVFELAQEHIHGAVDENAVVPRAEGDVANVGNDAVQGAGAVVNGDAAANALLPAGADAEGAWHYAGLPGGMGAEDLQNVLGQLG
jgi:hypothetical protein